MFAKHTKSCKKRFSPKILSICLFKSRWYLFDQEVDLFNLLTELPGQSDIDFLFNFVELSEGAHSGYSELSGRPSEWT